MIKAVLNLILMILSFCAESLSYRKTTKSSFERNASRRKIKEYGGIFCMSVSPMRDRHSRRSFCIPGINPILLV